MTTSMRTGLTSILASAAIVGAMVTAAFAQTAAVQLPPRHPIELALGGLVSGETSLGSKTAELIGPDGRPVTLFETDNALRPGFGLEAHLGVGLSRSFFVEASGSWSRADFRTRITNDIEGVSETVAKETRTRFAIEGAALWMFANQGKVRWFARGSAGWARDLTGNDSLVEDAIVGSAGGGMKYLWNPAARGFRIAGFRVEGRALMQKRGLVIGEDRLRVTPAAAGSLIIAF
jgi:hypothetical protein